MSFFAFANDPVLSANRRGFLKSSSGLLLTGTAIALLSGREALAAAKGHDAEGDVRILNTALGAEQEAVAAYQVGAESGLLQKPVLDLAVTFQGHHKQHAEVLAIPEATVRTRFFRARSQLREALSRELDVALDDAFHFAGERCDRITERVIAAWKQPPPRG